MYLTSGGDYDKAGYVYSSALEKIKSKDFSNYPVPMFAFFWVDLPLPKQMSNNVKFTVRISQLTSPIIEEKYKDYLVNDLFTLMTGEDTSDTLKDLAYKLIGFYGAIKGDMWLSQKCIEESSKLSIKQLKLPENLESEQKELNDKFKGIPTFLLFKSKNINEFKKNLSYGQIDISLPLAYAYGVHIIRSLLPQNDKVLVDWEQVLQKFVPYIEAVKKSKNQKLFIAFTTHQLLIEGKELGNIDKMREDYSNACKEESGELAIAMYSYALGYSYYKQEKFQEAKTSLLIAEKGINILPIVVSHKVYYLLSYLYAQEQDRKNQLLFINKINLDDDSDHLEQEEINLYGEKSVTYWQSGNIEKTVEEIGKALKKTLKLLMDKEDDAVNKTLLTKIGCCVSQWQFYRANKCYEENKVYPTPGLFTEHYEDVWEEGDTGMKEISIVLQMFQLEAETANKETMYWAEIVIEVARLHPNRLNEILKILAIPMIVTSQYTKLTELVKLEAEAKNLPAPIDMPKVDPTENFVEFYILPLLMEYVVEIQRTKKSGILEGVVKPLIKTAQSSINYCDKSALDRVREVIDGTPVSSNDDQNFICKIGIAMQLTSNCNAVEAFLYSYELLQEDKVYDKIVYSNELMYNFSIAVLKMQMEQNPEELDMQTIKGRGKGYIEKEISKYPYKKVMTVFYTALKDNSKINGSLSNAIMNWLGI